MSEDIAYRYTGSDPTQEHHSGVPARDLTADEFAALDPEQQATVQASALYEEVAPAKDVPAKDGEPDAVSRTERAHASDSPAPAKPEPKPEPPKQ